MLECRALAVSYGRHQALKGIDIQVAPGEIVVILGANGAGKTTLLKAISGLVPAQGSSRVALDGQTITNQPPHKIVEAGLALVPEGRGIFADLTVRENLLLGAFAHRARAQQQTNFERLMGLFPKLAERSAQQARTMSGGEQQMVAIGRALMSAPSILMLDEPSLGLSPLLCGELFKALRVVRDTGVGILLVEQNARQSLAIADRAYLLENGEIVGAGPAAQLASDPAVQAAYLGGAAAKGSVTHRSTTTSAASPAAPRTTSAASTPPVVSVPREAPAVPVGSRAASRTADALTPSRIDDLVRNAARVQATHLQHVRDAAPATRRINAPSPSLPPRGLPPSFAGAGVSADGDLAQALARVSAAAAAARSPAGPSTGKAMSGSALPRRTHTADADLPTIEIYRRPMIEIYRRSQDGSMKKET